MQIHSTAPLPTAAIGRVPGGYRIQVTYGPTVKFSGRSSEGESFEGEVVTGNDWILLRDDGVAVFDGKITFKANAPREHIFDADIDGRVDLTSIGESQPIRDAQGWRSLGIPRRALLVALPIAFETTDAVPPNAAKAIAIAGQNGCLFAEFAKHQFVARGTIEVAGGQIMSLDLRVEAILEQRLWPDNTTRGALIEHYARENRDLGKILSLLGKALQRDDGSWQNLCSMLREAGQVSRAVKGLTNPERKRAIAEALKMLPMEESPDSARPLINEIFGRLDRRNGLRAERRGN
jgi:hypothetical protein